MEEQNWQRPPKEARKPVNWKKLKRLFIWVLVGLVVLGIGSTCWYTVDDKQQAVVTTFGRVTDVTEAGIHFKLPLGMQVAHKVEVNVYQNIQLGYRDAPDTEAGYTLHEDESKMITGDYNIVNVEFLWNIRYPTQCNTSMVPMSRS